MCGVSFISSSSCSWLWETCKHARTRLQNHLRNCIYCCSIDLRLLKYYHCQTLQHVHNTKEDLWRGLCFYAFITHFHLVGGKIARDFINRGYVVAPPLQGRSCSMIGTDKCVLRIATVQKQSIVMSRVLCQEGWCPSSYWLLKYEAHTMIQSDSTSMHLLVVC